MVSIYGGCFLYISSSIRRFHRFYFFILKQDRLFSTCSNLTRRQQESLFEQSFRSMIVGLKLMFVTFMRKNLTAVWRETRTYSLLMGHALLATTTHISWRNFIFTSLHFALIRALQKFSSTFLSWCDIKSLCNQRHNSIINFLFIPSFIQFAVFFHSYMTHEDIQRYHLCNA